MGGRQRPPIASGHSRWTGSALFALAGAVALVWVGGSLPSDQPAAQPSQRPASMQSAGGDKVQPGPDGPRRPDTRQRPARTQPRLQPALPPTSPGPGAGLRKAPDAESIRIPAIDIDQELIELGVVGTALQVPDDYADVGWWSGGPVPGEDGAAVMVGHLDSPTGPAVFYRLSELRRGDQILVARENGSAMVFQVRGVQVYQGTKFPSAKVYRSHGAPALHLLTCGGSFDAEAGQYSSNQVVFADLIERLPAFNGKPGWYQRLAADSREKLAGEERRSPPRKGAQQPRGPSAERPTTDVRHGQQKGDTR